jgi:hypothetical protein
LGSFGDWAGVSSASVGACEHDPVE